MTNDRRVQAFAAAVARGLQKPAASPPTLPSGAPVPKTRNELKRRLKATHAELRGAPGGWKKFLRT